jgi:hypothetical protein
MNDVMEFEAFCRDNESAISQIRLSEIPPSVDWDEFKCAGGGVSVSLSQIELSEFIPPKKGNDHSLNI